jgi:hypothetical protein
LLHAEWTALPDEAKAPFVTLFQQDQTRYQREKKEVAQF